MGKFIGKIKQIWNRLNKIDLIKLFGSGIILAVIFIKDLHTNSGTVLEIFMKNYLDRSLFLSIIWIYFFNFLVNSIAEYNQVKHEDDLKVATKFQDVEQVMKKYSGESYISIDGYHKKWTTKNEFDIIENMRLLPGITLYEKQTNRDKLNLRILDTDTQYQLPGDLVLKMEELMRAHSKSKNHNSLNIRLKDLVFKDNELQITTERTTFFKSLLTNRVCDKEYAPDFSVRNLFEPGPRLTPLNESRLSNHLGMNIFVETEDQRMILFLRSKEVSLGKGTLGPSCAASLKTQNCLDENGQFTLEKFDEACQKELRRELCLDDGFADFSQSQHLVSVYRDIVECGKPQLVYYYKLNKTYEEYEQYYQLKNKKNLDTKSVYSLSTEDFSQLIKKQSFYEQYTITIAGKEFKVHPQHATAMVIVINYLKRCKQMKIIEQSTIGKKNDETLNEDGMVIATNYIAVIDGVTSKSKENNWPISSGVQAKEILCQALKMAPSSLSIEKMYAYLNSALRKAYQTHEKGIEYFANNPVERLQANAIVYSVAKKEIWFFGDCQCMVDGVVYQNTKKIDTLLSELRSFVFQAEGSNEEYNEGKDYGREMILPFLEIQANLNNSEKEYGYLVLDGFQQVPNKLKSLSVAYVKEIILASDGYPVLQSTLDQTEQELYEILQADPQLINKYKSTKGLIEGNLSFDDRTYIRMTN